MVALGARVSLLQQQQTKVSQVMNGAFELIQGRSEQVPVAGKPSDVTHLIVAGS